MLGEEDLAHAAGAERLDEHEAADAVTRLERSAPMERDDGRHAPYSSLPRSPLRVSRPYSPWRVSPASSAARRML